MRQGALHTWFNLWLLLTECIYYTVLKCKASYMLFSCYDTNLVSYFSIRLEHVTSADGTPRLRWRRAKEKASFQREWARSNGSTYFTAVLCSFIVFKWSGSSLSIPLSAFQNRAPCAGFVPYIPFSHDFSIAFLEISNQFVWTLRSYRTCPAKTLEKSIMKQI